MSKQVKLSVQSRTNVGRNSVKQLRARGVVPANIYGSKQEPRNLELNERDIRKLLAHAAGENILVDLEIVGDKQNHLALIQEVQHHPVRGTILHVDFLEVSMNELLHTEIPVEAFGEADGVKNYGGLLEQLVRHVSIECLPKDLPESIRVEVTGLGIGQSLHVRDLVLPPGVTVTNDPDLTIFLVAEPKVEDASKGEEVQQAPEVIKEKKPAAEQEGKK
ncbi:MAG: 50S ribosomal protein L25 [Chthoniobacterales bacterium]|nr:50S ribosomal protein L25 [Chthoniobacterales bacterium]